MVTITRLLVSRSGGADPRCCASVGSGGSVVAIVNLDTYIAVVKALNEKERTVRKRMLAFEWRAKLVIAKVAG